MDINIRSKIVNGAEFSWFAPLCNGDDRFLGKHEDAYKSNWENTSNILLKAEQNGFNNILCPSSYQVGQDTLTFASAVAPLSNRMNLLTAIRCGEVHPPMLGRAIATLDHILKGRLTINIISSNLPGEELSSEMRYRRSEEVIQILKQGWEQEEIDFEGTFYKIKLNNTKPVKCYQQNGGPLLYFGGYSDPGVDLCAKYCDVYLLWPETETDLLKQMKKVSDRAAGYDRIIDFGLRIHVIVRETSAEAKSAAKDLMKHIDFKTGEQIRNRALDSKSFGVAKQSSLRERSNSDGFAEPLLWTGIGKARSGCGAALVGSPEEVKEKIKRYMEMGFRSFIFSGYPHANECDLFADYVLKDLRNIKLNEIQNRVPAVAPETPLANAKRS